MATYKPRLKAPSKSDKNYIHYEHGGYNYCIPIENGSCLPNCVGYAWGRWRELLGKYHNLSRANAENWWGYTQDGYKRGKTPKLGAVVCWSKGKVGVESDGAGHVGIVEEINKDNIVVSMSAYGGTRWFTRTFPIGSYNYNSFVFQGFVYPPISFTDGDKKTTTNSTKPTKSEVAASFDNSLTGKYKTTDNLNIRYGAGTDKPLMITIPKGTTVDNYGYYTSLKSVKWLYIAFTYNGVNYIGFASSEYLTKVTASNTATSKKYFKRYTGNSGSIVDSLKAIGVNSSFAYRTKIANANGIKSYSSTAAQNIKLLTLLKQGKLISP